MLGVRTIAGRCDKMRRPFREPYDGANQAYARMAPEVGFEPTTNRLTADRSTTELLWIVNFLGSTERREICPDASKRQVIWLRGLPRLGGERSSRFVQSSYLIESIPTFLPFQI